AGAAAGHGQDGARPYHQGGRVSPVHDLPSRDRDERDPAGRPGDFVTRAFPSGSNWHTLRAPRLDYSSPARLLFWMVDVIYGRPIGVPVGRRSHHLADNCYSTGPACAHSRESPGPELYDLDGHAEWYLA